MPATVPPGAEAEVAFISGVTATATVAGTSWGAWRGDAPATYGQGADFNRSFSAKWGSPTLAIEGTAGGNVTYWFDAPSNWTTAEQNALASGLHLWSALANITFSLATSVDSANIVFQRGTDGKAGEDHDVLPGGIIPDTTRVIGGATHGTPASPAIISIDDTDTIFGPIGDPSLASSFDAQGGYVFNTIVHEVGHAIGLGHGGPYNAGDGAATPVEARQFSVYDMRLWTVMSYIDPDESNARLIADYPIANTDWTKDDGPFVNREFFSTTPMILDILAVQRIYGAPTSGPLTGGNLVFGFNSNIQGDVGNYYNFNINQNPIVTIWAGGSNNTIDLSGFSEASHLDLNFNTFSSAHGLVNNIAIAPDTQIKTGITGAGDDTIIGNGSANVLIGNDGNDTLSAFFGSDNLDGGDGSDTLVGGDGADVLNGGAREDTADYSDSFLEGVRVNLTEGQGFGGTAEGDVLFDIENLIGSFHDDVLIGDANRNVLEGGDGSDVIDGMLGRDMASYSRSLDGVFVDLVRGTATNSFEQDVLAGIEDVMGSIFFDFLFGNDEANDLYGLAGRDELNGLGGIDILDGGADDDRLDGGDGNDLLFGGIGIGPDLLLGGLGDDSLVGQGGHDTLDGGFGADTAIFSGNRADYAITFDLGRLFVADGIADRDATDVLFDVEFLQFADGTIATDTFLNAAPTAVALANVVASLAENAPVGAGIKVADIAVTDDGRGTNTLSLSGADAGSFQIVGTELFFIGASPNFEVKSSYAVTVAAQDATVAGSLPVTADFALAITDVNEAPTAVNDTLAAPFRANTPISIAASQLLANDSDPDAGDQALLQIASVAGATHGTVAFASPTDHTRIVFTPDENYTGPASFTYTVSDGHGGLSAAATVELAIVPNIVGTPGTPNLTGTNGADVIDAGTGNHLINARSGNDVIISGSGVDVTFGGAGNDRFVATVNDGNDAYNGDGGNDRLDLSQISTPTTVNLGTTLLGFTINGVGRATGSQIGTDLLTSVENVTGGSGADRITGDNLANVLDGGAGNDFLAGLGGPDTFVFKPGFGNDVVRDFTVTGTAHDFIELDHSMFPQFATVQQLLASAQVAQVGADVVITADAGDTITLQNVSLTALRAHADDFRFA